jgi:drug/metabolite transporter (DMT)-like permease
MKAIAALVLANLMWAGNYVVGGIVVHSMSPIALTWFRWLLAALPLLVVAQVVERPDWRLVLREWPRLLLLALLGVAGYALLLYVSLQFTTAVSASLINAANPAVMAVLAALLLRERIGWRGAAGLALGLVGVVLVISQGRRGCPPAPRPPHGGAPHMVAAIVVWSLYTIFGRSLAAPPIAATAVQATMAALLLTPLAVLTRASWPQQPTTTVALLFIAAFPSIGAYTLWNVGLKRIPPGRAGVYLNLTTVFTVLISVTMGVRLTVPQVLGGLLVFAGVGLSSLRSAPRASTGIEVASSRLGTAGSKGS